MSGLDIARPPSWFKNQNREGKGRKEKKTPLKNSDLTTETPRAQGEIV